MKLLHVLNSGVDKRNIFEDEKDYYRFVHNLYELNNIARVTTNQYYFNKSLDIGHPEIPENRRKKILLVKIHAFCLMPNHYHLLVSPCVENGIAFFMKKLNGGYAKYFNKRYKRNGTLFQGKYKSISIKSDSQFSWIPYYIHFNPLALKTPTWKKSKVTDYENLLKYLESYRWSSHLDYLGIKNFPSIIDGSPFSDYFNEIGGYKKSLPKTLRSFSLENFEKTTLE